MYHYQNSNSGYEEAYPDHPKYQPAAPETYGQSYDDPYYADEIEDDVPYYEDDPIHCPSTQDHPRQYDVQFSAPRYSAPAPAPLPPLNRGSDPRNSSGIHLRPPISTAEYSSSASSMLFSPPPTGSGKTVLFELAIIRMLRQAKESGESALCSERQRDWVGPSFDPLGIKCCELTGDTVQFGKGAWGDAKNATIIITTVRFLLTVLNRFDTGQGEKWDSLTRNWYGHVPSCIISRIYSPSPPFSIVQVHILNESRGSTLEVVISRMKTRGSAVRFVLVSATVPNIKDIAAWIGNKRRDGASYRFRFGEDFRPCKLTRHVIGLDFKVFAALQTHSIGKPILVFVSTRKGVLTTADQLLKEYIEAEKGRQRLPWTHPKRTTFTEKHLGGTRVHHAGLTIDDRRAVEDLYLKGLLRVVVATSVCGYAAHTVVIKGVQIFQNNMSGKLEQKARTIVESSLHTNLSEHINSEIGLGTITNVRSAKECAFRRTPRNYALGKGENQSWEERVDDMVMQSVGKLRDTKLIAEAQTGDKSGALASTEFGDIMSKVGLWMGLILALPERPTLRDIETKLRTSEKTVYNKLRRHNDIRFEVKKVEKTSDKVFLLIQAVLGGISLNSPDFKSPDSQPNLEAFSVFKHIPRIARVVVEVGIVMKRGAQLKHGLELVPWERSAGRLRQIESIGGKIVLAENRITSLAILAKQEPYKIETLLNRRSPFGHEVLASVKELPQYTLAVQELGVHSNGGKNPVELELSITCGVAVDRRVRRRRRNRRVDTKTFEITAELTKPSQSVVVYITSESIAGVTVTETYKPKLAYKEYPTRDTRPPTALDLDLEGLEDDPDFGTCLSMNTETKFQNRKVVRDPVVRDLTKPRVKKDETRPTKSAKNSTSKLHPKPKKLANGNYKCNHPCKDKIKCRHMCRVDCVASPSPIEKVERKRNTRPDAAMESLERLHERTNVNLKLPEGGPQTKTSPLLSISMSNLTQLDERKPATSYTLADLNDDDDDLPEPYKLLQSPKSIAKKREPSPETNYSDSEIDSLIRHAPPPKQDAANGVQKPSPSTPLPSRKRNQSLGVVLPPPKRSRFEVGNSLGLSSPASSLQRIEVRWLRYCSVHSTGLAVHQISDESDHRSDLGDLRAHSPYGESYQEDDDFILDCDILPTTPALTTASDDESKASNDISVTRPALIFDVDQQSPQQKARDEGRTAHLEMEGELDAWLNSGAVEIIGK
ncbi:hypothetical protein B0H14DRAFT_2814688 [Mycena olivaceomarginata]|nr:hypothetical protein B0H14DRAFT_2814688 [Mycena olivaceomarginata]